jgi:hypothetical protein
MLTDNLTENELWNLLYDSIAKQSGNETTSGEREYRKEINNRIFSLKTGVDFSKVIKMKANSSKPITYCLAMSWATRMALKGEIKNTRESIMDKTSEIIKNPEILKQTIK